MDLALIEKCLIEPLRVLLALSEAPKHYVLLLIKQWIKSRKNWVTRTSLL